MNTIETIKFWLKFRITKRKWRKMNKHNFTICDNAENESLFPINKVHVGKYSYGPLRVIPYSEYDSDLYIGNFCSIAGNVTFLLGGEHQYNYISTYPFKAIFLREGEAQSKGDIIVEDDVWIGYGATILSGVTLARGTIVAAGSVVVKSTEPYSIIGGNPAKLIKKRFSETTIEKLMRISFNGWDEKYIQKNINSIYKELE